MTALDHVGLSVADLDAQRDWYAAALGLVPTEPGGIPALGLQVVFLVDPDGTWALELLHRPGSQPGLQAASAPEAVLTQGFGHICLRVADVEELFGRLTAAGATPIMPPGPSPVSGVRMAFVADPEGNLIEMLDRPGPPGTPVDA
ncbi:VOC family protein [Microbacterium gorillae]|uniref:VOC family protein n=1 Tax=Microbacterium gorillae TaxID=1231063 RepID=UPI00058ED0C8|nr:VOC family protein [Microbacterium gorillae]